MISSSVACGFPANGLVGLTVEFQQHFFVQLRQIALGHSRQEIRSHLGEDAVVTHHGMVAECLAEHGGHQAGIASTFQQVFQAAEKLLTAQAYRPRC